MSVNDPPPVSITGNYQFELTTGRKHTGTLTTTNGDKIVAKDHKPSSNFLLRCFSPDNETWKAISVNVGGKEKTYWVKQEDMPLLKKSEQIKIAKELVETDRAAEAAKIANAILQPKPISPPPIAEEPPPKPTTELETLVSEAEMKAAEKAGLSRDKVIKVGEKIQTIGQKLEQAQIKEGAKENYSTEVIEGAKTEGLKIHKFTKVPFVIVEGELPAKAGVGQYKSVMKVTNTSSPQKTEYALALAHGTDSRGEKYSLNEAHLLRVLKDKEGVIPIEHMVYYIDKEGTVRPGMLMHFANGGDLEGDKMFVGLDKNFNQMEKVGKLDDLRRIRLELEKDNKDNKKVAIKLKVCLDISKGLRSCKENGVINGDVKPANVLLDRQGGEVSKAYLSDFGLAYMPKTTNENIPSEWNGGSMDYYAPEIWDYKNGHNFVYKEDLSYPIDAFAFGTLMCTLLYGPFFWNSNLDPDMANYKQARTIAIKALNNKIKELERSVPCGKIIARLLDPNPKTRMTIEAAERAIEAELKSYKDATSQTTAKTDSSNEKETPPNVTRSGTAVSPE